MKRCTSALVAAALLSLCFALATPVAAHDYDRGNSDYPLRYVAYLIHPLGLALEYGITRPVHWAVSQPYSRIIFGHDPRHEINEEGQYPVCPICQQQVVAVQCPHCNRQTLKPPDEYWGDMMTFATIEVE